MDPAMTQASPPSRSAARWILALAVLAVLLGGALVLVARRGDGTARQGPRDRTASPSSRRRHPADSTEPRSETPPPRRAAPRVDRRRLSAALRKLRRAADEERAAREGRGAHRASAPERRTAALQDEGEDDVQWPVTADGIRGAIRDRISEIKECYEGWLLAEPDLGGRLVVSFSIEAGEDGDARIRNAEIQGSSLEHSGMERCVLVMVESLQFEAPTEGPVQVRYPFRFSPGPR